MGENFEVWSIPCGSPEQGLETLRKYHVLNPESYGRFELHTVEF